MARFHEINFATMTKAEKTTTTTQSLLPEQTQCEMNFIFSTSVFDDFFVCEIDLLQSGYYILTSFLDETKHCSWFQQENRQNALIAL